MAIRCKGKAVLNPGTPDQTWGLCDDLEIAQEADKEPIKDGDGDTVGVQYTDVRRKVTGNYTPLAAAAAGDPPNDKDLIGKTIEITPRGAQTPIKVLIDDASLKYKRGGVPTFSFNGYEYPKLDTTAEAGAGT